MSIITLTTDFGIKDHFVAIAKGKLLSKIPHCQLVDVSHCIDLYNVGNASYVVSGAYASFPKNTIHIICVDAELHENSTFLLMRFDGHFFLAADNGICSLLTQEKEDAVEKVVRLQNKPEYLSCMDLFADVCAAISSGTATETLGELIGSEDYLGMTELRPRISEDGNAIFANIVYEDHYGNAVSNVSKKLFEEVGKGRPFLFTGSKYKMTRINKFYADFNTETRALSEYHGSSLLIFNDLEMLQVSLYKTNPATSGSVKSLLGLGYHDPIIIEFESKNE